MVESRLTELAGRWKVTVERVIHTPTSVLAFGSRLDVPVVLKVARPSSGEARVGAVAAAFRGQGMVRVYEHCRGAALLERLIPGTPLLDLVLRGDDLAATRTLAEVVAALHREDRPVDGFETVAAWGRGFERYASSGDRQIPTEVVSHAGERYTQLCSSQGKPRLLHGDLQHYNVLLDRTRGWIAIDPKGVVGELEFELGVALRNPHDAPALYSSSAPVARRVERFVEHLGIDATRVLEWAYVQAILSAIWAVEDEGFISSADSALTLAKTVRGLLR